MICMHLACISLERESLGRLTRPEATKSTCCHNGACNPKFLCIHPTLVVPSVFTSTSVLWLDELADPTQIWSQCCGHGHARLRCKHTLPHDMVPLSYDMNVIKFIDVFMYSTCSFSDAYGNSPVAQLFTVVRYRNPKWILTRTLITSSPYHPDAQSEEETKR